MSFWTLQRTNLDTTGVHGVLLPEGRVLYFSYDSADENNLDRMKWQVWNEAVGPLSPAATLHSRNLFCSGHCWLGDGTLLVAGGQSRNYAPHTERGADHDIHTFDPVGLRWHRYSGMPAARWYPTCVTLPDGNALIFGGLWTRNPPTQINHEAEFFYWETHQLSERFQFNPGFIAELYPFAQVLPDGSSDGLLWVHSGERSRLYSTPLRQWLPSTFRTVSEGNRNYSRQGAAVLLPRLPTDEYHARILLVGGGSTDDRATQYAQIFDFYGTSPNSSFYRNPAGTHPSFRRFMSDAVLLADGNVLVCGGAARGEADHSHEPVFDCEIFDSTTESFRTDSRINRPRMYHSSAVLLPSGRVALAGNTVHWNPDNPIEDQTVELYTPDYLLRGARPTLGATPDRIGYGQLVALETPDVDRVARVALVRCTTVTHTNNMDQRWVELVIVERRSDRINVRIPHERAICPPGWYMFFLLDDAGIPSIAKQSFLDLTIAPATRGCLWP